MLYAHVCLGLPNVSVLPCKGRLGVCKVAIHGSNALLLLRPGLPTTHRVFIGLLPLLGAKLGLGLSAPLLVLEGLLLCLLLRLEPLLRVV